MPSPFAVACCSVCADLSVFFFGGFVVAVLLLPESGAGAEPPHIHEVATRRGRETVLLQQRLHHHSLVGSIAIRPDLARFFFGGLFHSIVVVLHLLSQEKK